MARKAKPEKHPRRKPGTGAIRAKKGRALSWEAEWTHASGVPEYRGFRERVQAEEWLNGLVEKRDKGHDTTAGGLPFEVFIKKWLVIKQAKNIGPKTQLCYQFYAKVAAGEIGHIRIDCLTLEHMEQLCAYLVRARFQNIRELFGMLGQAFRYARNPSLRWMTVNPLEGLEIPKVERRKNEVLTDEQRASLLRVAAIEHDPDVPLLPLWHLYSRFGLRKGEGIALLWIDVDWEACTLTIDESISNVGPDNPRGKTKTKRTRVIPLPPDVMDMLRVHRTAQQKRGLFRAIFTGKDGDVVTPQHVQYRWSLLRKEAKCTGTTIHDLRHTALYLMALAGVPENVRMALAGHASTDMAELYANHASIEDVRRHIG